MRTTLVFLLLMALALDVAGSPCEGAPGPGAAERASPFVAGMPLAKDLAHQSSAILHNIGFSVGYSDVYRNPLWVCYRLFATCPCDARDRTGIDFRNDPRTLTTLTDDFAQTTTGMDRGHHAPNNAIAVCYGTQAQDETYLLTNISPQHRDLNQHIWKDLETRVLEYAEAYGEVWVITGAIMDPQDLKLLGTSGPDTEKPYVPKAFYKIVVRRTSSSPGLETLAFIFPNQAPEHPALEDYLRSIREIEDATHLDFLWQLEDYEEDDLETTKSQALWDLPTSTSAPTCAVAVINEFEANPSGSDTGREWVELFNPGHTNVSLAGWTLQTVTGSVQGFPLPDDATIPRDGFYVFDDSALRLSNGFEVIELRDTDGNLIDATPALGLSDNLGDGYTWSRIGDGGLRWQLAQASRNASNE